MMRTSFQRVRRACCAGLASLILAGSGMAVLPSHGCNISVDIDRDDDDFDLGDIFDEIEDKFDDIFD